MVRSGFVLLFLFSASLSPAVEPQSRLPTGAVARLADDRFRHADQPTALVFLPDGRLVSGGREGTVRVWDTDTGAMLREYTRPGIGVVSLSLTENDTRLAVSYGDDSVLQINVADLKVCSELATEHHEQFLLSPDNRFVATVNAGHDVKLLERENGLPMLELPKGRRVAFRPDSKALAVADLEGTVTVYLVAGGKSVFKAAHGGEVDALAFRRDGAILVTASTAENPRVKIWKSGSEKPVVALDASSPISWIGNDQLAVRRGDRVAIWDMVREKWGREIPGRAEVMAVSNDGSRLATASAGTRVKVWKVKTGAALHDPTAVVPDIALLVPSSDGKVAFGLGERLAFQWRVGEVETTGRCELDDAVTSAAIGGSRLAIASGTRIQLFDSFDPRRKFAGKATTTIEAGSPVRALAFSCDGSRLAYGGDDRMISCIDAKTGKPIGLLPTDTAPLALSFHPLDRRLALVGRDGFLRLFSFDDADKQAREQWKRRVQRGARGAIAFSPDGALLAAASATHLTVLDTAAGAERFALDRDLDDGFFLAITFSQDGRYLATASAGPAGAVQVWEVATRSKIRRFVTNLGSTTRIAFTPDGRRLLSTGTDEGITVWDVTGRENKPSPTAADLANAIEALDSPDSVKASAAVWTLVSGAQQSLPLLQQGLREIDDSEARVKALIAQLDAENFQARETANRELLALAHRALTAVAAAAENSVSSETRKRAALIRDKLAMRDITLPSHGLIAGELQRVRTVHVLEQIGGPKVKGPLETIAKRSEPAAVQAGEALKRLFGQE